MKRVLLVLVFGFAQIAINVAITFGLFHLWFWLFGVGTLATIALGLTVIVSSWRIVGHLGWMISSFRQPEIPTQ